MRLQKSPKNTCPFASLIYQALFGFPYEKWDERPMEVVFTLLPRSLGVSDSPTTPGVAALPTFMSPHSSGLPRALPQNKRIPHLLREGHRPTRWTAMPPRFSHNHQSPTATAPPGVLALGGGARSIWLWRPAGPDCKDSTGLGAPGPPLGRHTRLTRTETQQKQTPRERGPDHRLLERASGAQGHWGRGAVDAPRGCRLH